MSKLVSRGRRIGRALAFFTVAVAGSLVAARRPDGSARTAEAANAVASGVTAALTAPITALHGTDKPETIGRSVSHGCIRLRNSDIESLYNMVEVGTPIYIY